MVNAKVHELLNQQINKEFYSAYLYLDMSNYYYDNNLDGFGNWFKIQAQEERDHALLFMKYMQSIGLKVTLEAIGKPDKVYASVLEPLFADLPAVENDLTADNIQPRIRGSLLMAFANRMGRAVLGTGNKSENAVGYCTLYGDTVGAIEPIGDIYKNPEAWEFFSKMTGGKLGPDMPMWGMMQNFNLETMMTMMGSAPESAIKALNKQLNAFDLVD